MTSLRALAPACILVVACAGTAPASDAGAPDATTDATGSDASGDVSVSDASTGDSGGGACDGGACPALLNCCGGACKNFMNDPRNCGGCGTSCKAGDMCLNGKCAAATCQPACSPSQVCCEVNKGGPSGGPSCYDGITCPVGCPACN